MENTTADTSNFLNWVEIKNFKSINYLRLLSDLHSLQAPGFLTLQRILNDIITT